MTNFLLKNLGPLMLLSLAMIAHAEATETVEVSPPLDHGYTDLIPPVDDTHSGNKWDAPPASNVERAISFHTSVKDQGERGTCSYFSALGVLEAELIRLRGYSRDLDLSEQWLAYLNQRGKLSEGGRANVNFYNLAFYGVAPEAMMPYESKRWKALTTETLASERCGTVSTAGSPSFQTLCLNGHLDPGLLTQPTDWLRAYVPHFFNTLHAAYSFRDKVVHAEYNHRQTDFRLSQVSTIKKWIAVGSPLVLEVPFYYGAWSHGGAATNGIGRDADAVEAYAQGVVGYPEAGSKDRKISQALGDAHAVIVVGYDDDVVVNQKVPMLDGTVRTFSSRGVYYIRNSWGTTTYGSKFKIKNVPHPGYGVITQRYANEFGSFYRLPFRE